MKSLKQILATGALIVGGALNSFVNIGCLGPEDYAHWDKMTAGINPEAKRREAAVFGLLGDLLSVSPGASRNERALGRVVSNAANREADRQAYGNQEQASLPQAKPKLTFCSNLWGVIETARQQGIGTYFHNDIDGDGEVNFSDQREVIPCNTFYPGEKVFCLVKTPPKSRVNLKISDESGNSIDITQNYNDEPSQVSFGFFTINLNIGQVSGGSAPLELKTYLDNGQLYGKAKITYVANKTRN